MRSVNVARKWAGLPAARSRVLLTARPYAYADPRWHLAEFPVLALAPFDREQVERFVDRWHRAVRPALGWDRATAEARARRLSGALFQRERAYLARPLLTLMATLDAPSPRHWQAAALAGDTNSV